MSASASATARAEERIDFDGVLIEGQITVPAGAHIEVRSAESFAPLIEERSSFRREMANELRDVDEGESPADSRIAQAGSVEPCQDELYLALKKKDLESLSAREFEVFKAKDQACNEARVRTVATPAAPAPTPMEPVVSTTPDVRPAPTPAPTLAPAFGPKAWGAKDILLLTFGAVALLLLMMGGMLLLLLVLAA